jgi:hypothetical protein
VQQNPIAKVVPMPGSMGLFNFDVTSGLTQSNGQDKLIWGIGLDEEYNFDRATEAVHKDYRQLFYDKSLGSIGKVKSVEYELLLKNGNRTLEKYNFVGHNEDNEITMCPIQIVGSTTLLKKVA